MAVRRLKPKNDFVFGKLFGRTESKASLLALLNAILQPDGLKPIVDLTVIENRQLEKMLFNEKTGIVDIRARLEDGDNVNIEMQMTNRGNMIHRSLFYLSKLYASSIQSGEDYAMLKRTIVINLLDFELLSTKRFHNTYHLYEDHEREHRLTDLLEVHFIEFPKFERVAKDKSNPLHRWLMFMDEKLPEEELKELMRMDPIIEVTEEQLEGMSQDEFMRRAAEIREKAHLDWISSINYATQKGREEGREEGAQEVKAEIVRKLLRNGMSVDDVSRMTEMSAEEIERLRR